MITEAMVKAMEKMIAETQDENERKGMQKLMDMLCETEFD